VSIKKIASTIIVLLSAFQVFAQQGGHPHDPKMIFGSVMFMLMIGCILLLVKSGCLALGLLLSVLKPQKIIRLSSGLNGRLLKSFVAGILVLISYILLLGISQFIPKPYDGLLSIPVILLFFIHFILAFTVVSHFTGEKIMANISSHKTGSTFFAVLYGGIVILLCGFFPVLGIIVLSVIYITSLGGTATGLFTKN